MRDLRNGKPHTTGIVVAAPSQLVAVQGVGKACGTQRPSGTVPPAGWVRKRTAPLGTIRGEPVTDVSNRTRSGGDGGAEESQAWVPTVP